MTRGGNIRVGKEIQVLLRVHSCQYISLTRREDSTYKQYFILDPAGVHIPEYAEPDRLQFVVQTRLFDVQHEFQDGIDKVLPLTGPIRLR